MDHNFLVSRKQTRKNGATTVLIEAYCAEIWSQIFKKLCGLDDILVSYKERRVYMIYFTFLASVEKMNLFSNGFTRTIL